MCKSWILSLFSVFSADQGCERVHQLLYRLTTTIVSPLFLTTAIFNILGLIIRRVGTQYSWLSPHSCTSASFQLRSTNSLIHRPGHLHVTRPCCTYFAGHWWWKGLRRRAGRKGRRTRREHYDVRCHCPGSRNDSGIPSVFTGTPLVKLTFFPVLPLQQRLRLPILPE